MSAGGTFRITMRKGPTPGKVIDLTKDVITLGRDVGNDVVINDAEISRHHARLTMEGAGYVLEDLGSTNGTFVNGHRISGPHALQSGDLIGFGETVTLVHESPMEEGTETMIAGMAEVSAQPTVRPPAPVEPALAPRPAAQATAPPSPPPPPEPQVYTPPPPPDIGVVGVAEEPAPRSKVLTWVIGGCGCLVILSCVALAVFLWQAPAEFYESLGITDLINSILGP